MHGTRAWWGYVLLNLLTLLRKQRVSQKVHLRLSAEATAASYSIIRPKRSGKHSLPDSLPSVGQADLSIKKPRCNLLLQRGLNSRGDWIRTSDLLNPIQAR